MFPVVWICTWVDKSQTVFPRVMSGCHFMKKTVWTVKTVTIVGIDSKSRPLIHSHTVLIWRAQMLWLFLTTNSSNYSVGRTAAWLDWQSLHERTVGDSHFPSSTSYTSLWSWCPLDHYSKGTPRSSIQQICMRLSVWQDRGCLHDGPSATDICVIGLPLAGLFYVIYCWLHFTVRRFTFHVYS